jgi:cell division transport system permease protein
MMAWLRAHAQAAWRAWRRLRGEPVGTLLSVTVIACAIVLPLFLHVLVSNASAAAKRLATGPVANVYFKLDADEASVRAAEKALRSAPGVESVRFISRDQALNEMKRRAGMAEVLAHLESNPLPHSLALELGNREPAQLAALKARIASLAGVDDVAMDFEWAAKLHRAAQFADKLTWLLALALGLAVVFVLGNTIRLQILTQRDEIAVCRLLGATRNYIRRPFLYLGALQGALSGALGVAVTMLGVDWAAQEIRVLTESYGGFEISGIGPGMAACAVLVATALGWMGGYVSVSRHLRPSG